MSFFRNLRSSITRGRSSSRDTTPVRSSRPASVLSGSSKRRDSLESGSDSLFNRSDTFILDDDNENAGLNSNTSTLEKKSKKSKVLEKFSTFTKRKKTPTPDSSAYEHHPSDNATNTYYKWQAEGTNSLDYDCHNDPFNFLYEQSSLKSLHNANTTGASESLRSPANSLTNSANNTTFDGSTYRKGKMPKELKKQLEHLKQSRNLPEHLDDDKGGGGDKAKDNDNEDHFKRSGYENLNEADKYKTVTLNSFRKSFRDKFMQHQKDTAHNPSWFVEVEPPPEKLKTNEPADSVTKENRPDFLVFENDNYRPGSRSPIRDARKTGRSLTRSPVKRNETFKVDRSMTPHAMTKTEETNTTTPSIRIEFRNSITPHMPGRMVPVGVAKPMPSQITTTPYYARAEPIMNTSYTIKTSSTRVNGSQSPQRNWPKPLSRSPSRNAVAHNNSQSNRSGRYQTLVEIKNDSNTKIQQPTTFSTRPSRMSTRIQLNGGPVGHNASTTPSSLATKRYPNTPAMYNSSAKQTQPLKQTYFGDNHHHHHQPQLYRHNATSSPSALTSTRMVQQSPAFATSATTNGSRTYGQQKTPATPVFQGKSLYQTTLAAQSRSTASQANMGQAGGGAGGGGVPSYLKHHQRIVVPTQRRSRSPIKIPWR